TQHLITLAPPLHHYGFAKGRRYYALNLLSEIDRPGEWYLDRTRGVLYLWPPSNPNRATVELSMLAMPFVELDGVSHVTFRGLTWETGRDDGLRIKGGEHCLLAGCTVRNLAGDGVVIEGGKGHGLLSCDIYNIGRGGTILRGGDRRTLTPSGHFAENCHLHHLSRIDHTYTPAVLANGVGMRIAHNLMHHIGSSAMRVEGNDHLVEFNEVHNAVRESDDQGGVDVFGNPTYRGNVYRHNFFHDIGSGRSCGQAGIRLDDAISGTLIHGNVFWRCSEALFGGVQIHGGKDNIVDNNLFVDCKQAISFSPWGQKRWEQFLTEPMAAGALKQVDITQPPYSTRYPELATLREKADANHIWRNLAVRCGK
ncbi:MAG: right-handed parallel beta-helix repeat-containing protein, partial [Verrucomicrobia bacterium]|nr:right-handed parallel beta-helix repeat-containing protein [Verrucomicrobiota bacterium]